MARAPNIFNAFSPPPPVAEPEDIVKRLNGLPGD
jgi:hypothetical protein